MKKELILLNGVGVGLAIGMAFLVWYFDDQPWDPLAARLYAVLKTEHASLKSVGLMPEFPGCPKEVYDDISQRFALVEKRCIWWLEIRLPVVQSQGLLPQNSLMGWDYLT